MVKNLCPIFLLFCLLFTLSGCQSGGETAADPVESTPPAPEVSVPEMPEPEPETPELSQREQDWIEDIEYLREQYKLLHVDPFYLCSKEEFDWKLDHLMGQIEDLSDSDLFYELAAVIAGMGDNHTLAMVPSFAYESYFPLSVVTIGNKIYPFAYLEGYEQFAPYLLQEIVAINGIDMTYLLEKVASISSPTNTWSSRSQFSNYYFIPSVLDWAGCDYMDGYTFQFLNENQEVVSVDVPVLTETNRGTRVLSEEAASVPGLRFGNRTEYLEGENGGCVYIAFNEMTSTDSAVYRELFGETVELIKAHPDCNKLVIDLRLHIGGNSIPLADVYFACAQLQAPSIEQTYVLTGGTTISAAMDCISFFKSELDAVTVGEPTGQFTTFFGYNKIDHKKEIVLPHSQISVVVADWRWKGQPNKNIVYDENGKLYEWENTVLPDVFIPLDIEDVRQGKDSALEWVFAQ